MANGDLQERLERLGRALVEDIEAWERGSRDERRKALEKFARKVGEKVEAAVDRQQHRQHRRDRRRGRRQEKERLQREHASFGVGAVFLAFALACGALAVIRPELWWMVFVALGLALSGAHQLQLAAQRRGLERDRQAERDPVETQTHPEVPVASRPHEVDEHCDALLADLAQSPEAVRSFLANPERTVASLRKTARALDERRQQLLAQCDPNRLRALELQRQALEKKQQEATDPQARGKLGEALLSLDGQLSALRQLRAVAERVDGEYTSLLVLLQELRTRVAVARTAGSEVQIQNLKQSVSRLNLELEAITEALHAAPREGLPLSAVSPVGESSEAAPGVPGVRRR